MSTINLTPEDVKRMSLNEFEKRFGFRPVSAIEKHYFAGMGKRPDVMQLVMIEQGVLGMVDTTGVVMTDGPKEGLPKPESAPAPKEGV